MINEDMIENLSVLAKLSLGDEEKKQVANEISKMIKYIEVMNEVNTEDVNDIEEINEFVNVFREDVVVNGDNSFEMLKNAPDKKGNMYCVPKTI